jgi:drug/metabolite transporter (DMT)-like permease
MTPLEWALLFALSAVWGASFVFNSTAVRELPVFTVVVCRVALAALILLAVLLISEGSECLLSARFGWRSRVWGFSTMRSRSR